MTADIATTSLILSSESLAWSFYTFLNEEPQIFSCLVTFMLDRDCMEENGLNRAESGRAQIKLNRECFGR